MTDFLPRDLIAIAFPGQPRLQRAFEDQAIAVVETVAATAQVVEATSALEDGTYLTLSPNAALTNERVLTLGTGLSAISDGNSYALSVDPRAVVTTGNGFTVQLIPPGDCTLFLPLTGYLATRGGVETFANKTLDKPKLSGLGDYLDDAAAAAGGVPVGGMYRNGSVLMVRVA